IDKDDVTVEFLTLIRKYNYRVRSNDFATIDYDLDEKPDADNGVVRAVDFGSVVDHVISNFAAIVTQSYNVSNLFVQNAPKRVKASLRSAFPEQIEEHFTEYETIDKETIKTVHRKMGDAILGQQDCKREIALSLYRLSSIRGSRPIVLLFYGPSGVGKTESAKCLSDVLGGTLTRVQISMMQTNEAYDYIFGAEHSKGSFARDLLARESNVILLDEFDKVNHSLYNAFYQLFDEGVFVDTNYEVDMKDGIFILTSNFMSEEEVRRELGLAMFSRIGACIAFDDLPIEAKQTIAQRHYTDVINKLDGADKSEIEDTDIASWFQANAERYDNMRIMKTKIDRAVFGHLTDKLLESAETEDLRTEG
ncbi:MAG: ATP-dependent Clp protease ATP-binding subunit, partial [Eggerthellaceae bacterium]|nr:ATP-dependent Clp protease ATP-binding subunit [Eggerthellaceae bacterium]